MKYNANELRWLPGMLPSQPFFDCNRFTVQKIQHIVLSSVPICFHIRWIYYSWWKCKCDQEWRGDNEVVEKNNGAWRKLRALVYNILFKFLWIKLITG